MISLPQCSIAQIQIGKGDRVLFWKDRWLMGSSVGDIAPHVLAQVCSRRCNCWTIQVALIHNKWIQDIQGPLIPEAAGECAHIWLCIMRSAEGRNMEEEDTFCWPCSSKGQYSAKSTYNRLQAGSIQFAAANAIWKNGAPLKCKIFMWLSILDKHWTSARHACRGLQNRPDPCYVCLQGEDDLGHMFMQCVHARQVSIICFGDMGVAADPPTVTCTLKDCG
jgi:hypothetical protein